MIIPEVTYKAEEVKYINITWETGAEVLADETVASAIECFNLDVNVDELENFESLIEMYPDEDWAGFFDNLRSWLLDEERIGQFNIETVTKYV